VWDIENTNPAIDTLSNKVQVKFGRGYITLISFLAFSKDGQLIASGSDDSLICLWDTDDKAYICSFYKDNKTDNVLSLVFLYNLKLKFLIAMYRDNIVCI